MSTGVAEKVVHALHVAEHSEVGKAAVHKASAAIAGTAAAILPFAPAVVIAFAPAAIAVAAVWGLCKLFDK
jgi:hypothetical protein